ncbi:MAG: hypothetical protein U1E05_07950 [Patescibacteria group bacterium]|nr:hypothetical protein [Patescibacteria group bacterium]
MSLLVVLIYLFVAWGWVLLAGGGLFLLSCALKGKSRVWKGVAAILLALLWQQATLPFNFGNTLPTIRSADGHSEAYLQRKGGVHYTLVVHREGRELKWQLPGFKPPDSVFWMLDDSAIGIDHGRGDHMIVYVDLYLAYRENPTSLKPEEEEKLAPFRQLTQEEELAFELAKRKADSPP